MTPPSKRTDEVRCHCGSLIARIVDGKLELKCRRCQRIGLIELGQKEPVAIEWVSSPSRGRTER
jgi:phage FluMu protein Com